MRSVLFDTNIILDIALERSPYFGDAAKLFSLIDAGEVTGYVTASTITDIYYISKKERRHEHALGFIADLIEVVNVIGIDYETIIRALQSDMRDFEDAIQVAAAEFVRVEYIVTRNTKDFVNSSLKVRDPKGFLTEERRRR